MTEFHRNVINDYVAGMPEKELLNKYNVTRSQVNKIRKDYDVLTRTANALTRYNKNKLAGETIMCAICNLEFQSLIQHVKIHGLTNKTYIQKYGKSVRTKTSALKVSSAHVLKFKLHPELKEKLRIVGRQNITKVNNEGKGWKMPIGFWSDEQKLHMSKILTGRNVTWNDKIKNSHWSKGDHVHDVIDAICAGSNRFRRGYFTSVKTGNTEFYHSSYELRRMQELDADVAVVNWTKRHKISVSYWYDNTNRVYIPDFLIEKNDGSFFLEEVKGFVKDTAKHMAKCSAAKKWCLSRGYTYVVNFMRHVYD